MNRGNLGLILALQTALLWSAAAVLRVPAEGLAIAVPSADGETRVHLAESYGLIPLHFEPNLGQADPRVRFLARGGGRTVYLTPREAVFVLPRATHSRGKAGSDQPSYATGETAGANRDTSKTTEDRSEAARMRLIGASPDPEVEGFSPLPGKSHYFIGNDRTKWHTNIPTYSKVRYREVYPGIDLIYYGNPQQLEFDFIVSQGADPKVIQMEFEGAGDLQLGENGDLSFGNADSSVRLKKPLVYQERAAGRQEIEGRYRITANHQVTFDLAEHDPSLALVIDPVLAYSASLGGSSWETAQDVAVDRQGNAYVTGETKSADFPVVSAADALFEAADCGFAWMFSVPCSDAFVTKLNATGTEVVYSTYLGGRQADIGVGIDVDGQGFAYVTGNTRSVDFPLRDAVQDSRKIRQGINEEIFVAKLSPDGSRLVYSTYWGGWKSEVAGGIAAGPSGEAWVTGSTHSPDFPTRDPLKASLTANSTLYISTDGGEHWGADSSSIGGRQLIDLVFSPRNPSIMYASTTSGPFSTRDAGSVWIPLDKGPDELPVRVLAVDPRKPLVIYGATHLRAFKSVDGGATWTAMVEGLPQPNTPRDIVVDPTNPAVVYVTLDQGVFRSTDAGDNWSELGPVEYHETMFPNPTRLAVDRLLIDPVVPSVLYAQTGLAVFKSIDAGASWLQRNEGLGRVLSSSIVMDPVDRNTLYVLGEGPGPAATTTVYRSTDAAENWLLLKAGLPSSVYSSLVIDPTDPSVLFTNSRTVLKSVDRGATWQPASDGIRHNLIAVLRVVPTSPARLYAAADDAETSDVFLTQFSSTGTVLFSTFLGGSESDFGRAVAVDNQGNVYLTGSTGSPDFPQLHPAQSGCRVGVSNEDVFVTKLDANTRKIVYSTCIGGMASESGAAITVDASGNAYVAGVTASRDFPAKPISTLNIPGINTGFILKLPAMGDSLLYSTLVEANITGVAVDKQGRAVVTGITSEVLSTTEDALQTLPVFTPSGSLEERTAFVVKFSANGEERIYSTFLGGTSSEQGNAIAVDQLGNAYVAGFTNSADFPHAPGSRSHRDANAFVVKIDFATPSPSAVTAVTNAASLLPGRVAPGEIVSLFGRDLGPTESVGLEVSSAGTLQTTLAGTRVLFDGKPAPLIFVSAKQINTIVPYSVGRKDLTQIQVERQGSRTPAFPIAVGLVAPGIFTLGMSGRGQGAALNQDLTINSPSNPASRGSYVVIFATGEGQTEPAGKDGTLTPVQPLPRPRHALRVEIDGLFVQPSYAGGAPGLVAGVLQVNARVPEEVKPGPAVPIRLYFPEIDGSQPGVTLAVK